jgi:hypothetical protein
MAWKEDQLASYNRTAHYTEVDEPSHSLQHNEFQNVAFMRTITHNPDLIQNLQVIGSRVF